jgi:hypothetical protein
MRDCLSLINTTLTKDGINHQIKDISVSCLNHTYITVECSQTCCLINYKFTDFQSFLTDNGFSLRESIAKEYQFKD